MQSPPPHRAPSRYHMAQRAALIRHAPAGSDATLPEAAKGGGAAAAAAAGVHVCLAGMRWCGGEVREQVIRLTGILIRVKPKRKNR